MRMTRQFICQLWAWEKQNTYSLLYNLQLNKERKIGDETNQDIDAFILIGMRSFSGTIASNASWGYVQAAAAESDGEVDYSTEYVVLSLEGFTLGQGFYIEPERMSYKEIGEVWKEEGIDIDLSKLTVSQATYAFFKKEGLETEPSGTDKYNSSSYYLANVKGIDKGAANVPQELKDAYQKKNGKALELKDKTGKILASLIISACLAG